MSTATFTSSAIAAATSTPPPAEPPGAENGECRLLGPFAILVQAALGVLALSSLVFKRWRERPQRPVKVWAFDASKQVVGSVLLHLANLLMSMLSSGQLSTVPSVEGVESVEGTEYRANPCSFYLLNLAIDTTLGIPILILWLRVFTHAFSLTPFGQPAESIRSGNYGQPPRYLWWLKQCGIYFLGLLAMKACVFALFKLCPWIGSVGDWALRWTEGNERVQLFFVMLFFPLVMNALQYYIIDGFIKNRRPEGGHEPLPTEDPADGVPPSASAWDASFESEDEADDGKRAGDERTRLMKPSPAVKVEDRTPEYDPRADGEDATLTSGGSSRGPGSANGGRPSR